MALLGCDPTAGIADTADAALPQIKRYFDGPGTRLDDGPWSRVVVDLDLDTRYHLGARRLDDAEPTFHLFDADAREGCAVAPNAGTWLAPRPPDAPTRLLPFVESLDERGHGRLRFTTVDCEVQDLVIEDGAQPFFRGYDHGFLIPTKRGYTFADPWAGEAREIAADLRYALIWNDTHLFWADGKLKSFSDQLEPGNEWGNDVRAVVSLGGIFLVEDADGMHRVRYDADTLEIAADDVLEGACGLQLSNNTFSDAKGYWVAAQMPCGNANATLIHIDNTTFELVDSITLPVPSDSRYTRVLPQQRDSVVVLAAAAYLTEPDGYGRGTGHIWQLGSDTPFELGPGVALADVSLSFDERADWVGSAFVNYRSLGSMTVFDWIRFRWDGTIDPFAERLVRNATSGEVLVNFDGQSGDLASFQSGKVEIVASKLPAFGNTRAVNLTSPHFARVGEFDGTTGEVLIGTEPDDPASWRSLGSGALPDQLRFLSFMPALLFLQDWDTKSKTGTLVSYNYELDASDTIATGVSSFDVTSYPVDGLLYTVPLGKQRGIWFTKAK